MIGSDGNLVSSGVMEVVFEILEIVKVKGAGIAAKGGIQRRRCVLFEVSIFQVAIREVSPAVLANRHEATWREMEKL